MKTAGKNSNVVTLRCGAFLNECEADLKASKPWSEEKTHIMFLLAQYINHTALSVQNKMRALSLIAEHSDIAAALAKAGYSRTITVSQLEHANLTEYEKNLISWKTSR